ncbi:MAG: hypothetical protein LBT71_11740 [Azoarcus sp.]|jgi:hypothetical protein|nr:hypothetical protein [Azoarcus sp.]
MQAYKFDTTLPASRHLEITLPETFPVGERMEVICLVKSDAPLVNDLSNKDRSTDIEALLAWQQSLPHRLRSVEDIEAQIAEERNSWGD